MIDSRTFIKQTNGMPIVIDFWLPYWGLFPVWALFWLGRPEYLSRLTVWWGVN
jgi:hypothetical protein